MQKVFAQWDRSQYYATASQRGGVFFMRLLLVWLC